VDALVLDGVDAVDGVALLDLLLGGQVLAALQLGELGGKVRDHELVRVVRRDQDAALVQQIDVLRLLVDRVEQVLVELVQALVAQVLEFRVVDELLERRLLRDQLHEALVLGRGALDLEQLDPGLGLLLGVLQQLLAVRQGLAHPVQLRLDHAVHQRLQLVERLVAVLDRARDDQRRAGLVHQHRVHLVHDGVDEAALHAVLRPHRHVVAQVVEAELVVGAVGDVTGVLQAPLGRVHALLDAAHGQAEELVDLAHPLAVAAGQVVVHRDQVGAPPGQGVEVQRHGGHQGLALARGHLGDPALVQHDAADELHVVGHHVPADGDPHHLPGLADQPAAGLLDRPEGLGQNLLEHRLLGLPALDRVGQALERSRDPGLEFGRLPLQLLVAEVPAGLPGSVDLVHDRPHSRDVAVVFGAEYLLQQAFKHGRENSGSVKRTRIGGPGRSRQGRLRPGAWGTGSRRLRAPQN
jgi:hypothetical protein